MFLLRTAALGCRAVTGLRSLSAGYTTSRGPAEFIQGQSPEPRIREYFYYIDHHGQLFLDDTKVKNFVTCFKDTKFLVFFFSRLRSNQSGRYEEDFPFLSLCGRERNFLRCDDRPVVFTHLMQTPAGQQGLMGDQELLSYCGGEEKLAVPFRPEALYMHPLSGRVYHPCSERWGGVGLVRSALAIELSPFFVYPSEQSQSEQPTHFVQGGQKHTLTNELAGCFPSAEEGSGQQGEPG
ncbi:UPF0598 protein C8orf82 homolog [Hippoglossus hippoglossus]|uniref:UPF0598 protein C8orf82 homolog n=1 Tax=Hippoglossus hippoglossus TaxID=8267 RepID=UPI00148E6DA3|nr:UPF0598 protein C8orf82 homolog [Hippoglossus hippoglossus]